MGGFAWNPLLWWMGMPQTTPNASSFRNWALRIYAPPNGWQLGWFIVDQRDMNWHGVDQMTLSLLDSEHRPWVVKEEAHILFNDGKCSDPGIQLEFVVWESWGRQRMHTYVHTYIIYIYNIHSNFKDVPFTTTILVAWNHHSTTVPWPRRGIPWPKPWSRWPTRPR